MGQYHLTVNLDKKEFLDPHQLGDGLKLVEQAGRSHPGGTNDALHLLLAVSNGRGGGDFQDSAWVGRWGGDRIAVVGDYAEDEDLPAEFEAEGIYERCRDGAYRDITPELIPVLEEAYEVVYVGMGWRDRIGLFSIEGLESTCASSSNIVSPEDGSRIAIFQGGEAYSVTQLREALKAYGTRERREKKIVLADLRPFLGEPLGRVGLAW